MNPQRPLLGVSVCLFHREDVLLVGRGRGAFAGLLSFPGGRVEFGETLADAALRELQEETGIRAQELRFLRLHEAIDVAAGIHAVIAVFHGSVEDQAGLQAASDAASAAFHPLAEIGRLESKGRTTPGLASIAEEAALLR